MYYCHKIFCIPDGTFVHSLGHNFDKEHPILQEFALCSNQNSFDISLLLHQNFFTLYFYTFLINFFSGGILYFLGKFAIYCADVILLPFLVQKPSVKVCGFHFLLYDSHSKVDYYDIFSSLYFKFRMYSFSRFSCFNVQSYACYYIPFQLYFLCLFLVSHKIKVSKSSK